MIYEIKHHSEETGCAQCGYPLRVGDEAHLEGGIVFCSLDCIQGYASDTAQGIIHYAPFDLFAKDANALVADHIDMPS